jgi:hypothetical protein
VTDGNTPSGQSDLELEVAGLEIDLKKCLDSKNSYTSFIADMNQSLVDTLKKNEDLQKLVETLKSTPCPAANSTVGTPNGLSQENNAHNYVYAGGRPH